MSDTRTPKAGGIWEVSRKLSIPALAHEADGVSLTRTLESLEGVKQAVTDVRHHHLKLRYDASVIDYLTLVKTLEEQGYPLTRNWWSRLKGNWYQFTDSNARENANLPPPACCNKAPKKR